MNNDAENAVEIAARIPWEREDAVAAHLRMREGAGQQTLEGFVVACARELSRVETPGLWAEVEFVDVAAGIAARILTNHGWTAAQIVEESIRAQREGAL